MQVNDYVTIASQSMIVGAGFGCIVILIGYVVRFVFRSFMEGGKISG